MEVLRLLWREWRALMVVAAWRCRSAVLQGVEVVGSRRTLRFGSHWSGKVDGVEVDDGGRAAVADMVGHGG